MANPPTETTADSLVRRRKVFFISGYDPKGPAWYHGLFRDNAEKQARVSGMQISVSARKRRGRACAEWQCEAIENGAETTTDYAFLRWDDIIIRHHWPRGPFKLFWLMLKTYAHHLKSGFLWRTYANAWPTFIAGAYPAVLLVLAVLVIGLAGFVAGLFVGVTGAIVAGVLAALLAVKFLTPLMDKKLGVYWLVRIYAFLIPQARGETPELNARYDDFATLINQAARSQAYDEILVVGHSTGAQAAISVLSIAVDQDPEAFSGATNISLATIGGSVSMLAWQAPAVWFRKQLVAISRNKNIHWIDFSAAQDGACFALLDPIKSIGLTHPDAENPSPKLLSIRLFELYDKATFKQIRRNWNLVHFQYLMASQLPADYDYFAVTCGSKTLKTRYRHRDSAKNFDRFRSRWFKPPTPFEMD